MKKIKTRHLCWVTSMIFLLVAVYWSKQELHQASDTALILGWVSYATYFILESIDKKFEKLNEKSNNRNDSN